MHVLCSWDVNEHFPLAAQSPDLACPVPSGPPCPQTGLGRDKLHLPAQASCISEWGVCVSLGGLSPLCNEIIGPLQGWNLPSCHWEGSARWPLLVLVAKLWAPETVPLLGGAHGPSGAQVGKLAPGLAATPGSVSQQALWLQGVC